MTAPLDREESECYRLLLVCTVQTETLITKVETPLHIFVNDEDDNAPYVNGTDTADIVISFNRTKVSNTDLFRVVTNFIFFTLLLSFYSKTHFSHLFLGRLFWDLVCL